VLSVAASDWSSLSSHSQIKENAMTLRKLCWSAFAMALAMSQTPAVARDDDAQAKDQPSLFSLDRGRLLVRNQGMELRWDLSSHVASLRYEGRTEELMLKPLDPSSYSVLADKTLIVVDGNTAVGEAASEPCSNERDTVVDAMNAVRFMCQTPESVGCLEARQRLTTAAANYSACILRFYQQEN
jgi:hypothetical protein